MWCIALTLWPSNWYALFPVGWAIFLPILVFLGLFLLDLSANTCQTYHATSSPRPLTLEIIALVGDVALCSPIPVNQVWSNQAFQFGRYDALPFSALVDLVTLTFDPFEFWPRNWCALLFMAWAWATFLPILVSLRRFVLDLRANTCQTDHVTLRPWPLTLEVMTLVVNTGLVF